MNTPDSLIAKYLAEETNAEETQLLNSWRSLSQENESTFQELKKSWKLAQNLNSGLSIPNKEKVWTKINDSIQQTTRTIKMYNRSTLLRAISLAASVALILGFALTHFLTPTLPASFTTVMAPSGQKAKVELPDGTQVWLNSGSSLTYATNFDRENREVELHGEAFFDVTKSKKHQFQVNVGDVSVNVFGTAFNVNGYDVNKQVEISLVRGKVSVNQLSTGKLLATMKPDQKALISISDEMDCQLLACDASTESLWHEGKLKIENETMDQLEKKMEKWYGVNISMDNQNNTKRYYMTIKTESLTEMLEVINKITPITYTLKGEEVMIKYN